MINPPSRQDRHGVGRGVLTEIERLEAPDRSFIGHRDIITRSLARYHAVLGYTTGQVLDIGCGRGYGFDVLSAHSSSQTGVDISLPFLSAAQRTYRGVAFAQATGEHLPFRSGSFDTAIAFEVIEHLQDDKGFLEDLLRLVRPGGTVAISTPNRLVSSGASKKPLNPFHVREYSIEEFEGLLQRVFSTVTLLGQHDRTGATAGQSKLVDRIPVEWKYLLPTHIQGVMSVMVRPPLRLEDCVFTSEHYDQAHTFLAICRV
jgi:SAM-dependent methyltransferase